MNQTPKVSIILPTYNGSKYIQASIDSCLSQTFKDFELIIVDDCSKDQTSQIIAQYNDPRIKYIRNAINQRLPGSLNIGLKHSQGGYLTWTSDDNVYKPEAIERMVIFLETRQVDFVYTDIYVFKNDDIQNAHSEALDDYEQLSKSNCIRACFLYSRGVYNQIGDYDPDMELIEDYDYWVRVSKNFKMHHIKEPLYYYRFHEKQLYTARNQEIKIIELLFKLKYGFNTLDEVNWSIRDFLINQNNHANIFNRIFVNLLYKKKIQCLLRNYCNVKTNFTQTCLALNHIINRIKDTP